jgi:hypothetical protein
VATAPDCKSGTPHGGSSPPRRTQGLIAQRTERLLPKQRAGGSSPSETATHVSLVREAVCKTAGARFNSGVRLHVPVAQRTELLPPKKKGGGSNPSRHARCSRLWTLKVMPAYSGIALGDSRFLARAPGPSGSHNPG